jgi:hypothetical protein
MMTMRIPTMVKTSSLVGSASWAVKMGETGAYSGDLERAFLPAEWLLSAAR